MAEKIEKSEVAKREEEILKFWRDNRIFEKSLSKESPLGEYVFYDGPPFANGKPHYGHILGSTMKDVFGRYKTMRGFHVERRWGWDCHGLPIESIVEKTLGLKTKKDVEVLGVEKFNACASESVWGFVEDWKETVARIGRWVEFDNAYKTMDSSYTESVWWALKTCYEKGLLYEGRKVLMYCPHCETPLAKAEIAMDNSYKDVTETSVTLEFKVKDPQKHDLPENTYLLAWTTTPWTLPGNVGLAVGEDIIYAKVKCQMSNVKSTGQNSKVYILAEALVSKYFRDREYEVLDTIKGRDLVGIEYEPLFELEAVRNSGKKGWFVMPADFVSTEDGTGIVHTAVIYGEDDYELGKKFDLPMVPTVDHQGKFNENAPEFLRGRYFKGEADKLVIEDLKKRELLFSEVEYTHSYPHCYRCGTALMYNAITSWFLNVQKVKERIIALNEKINWVPEHLKHSRFLNILENAPDWTISRNRFWASPLPIWKCERCQALKIIGSVNELREGVKSSSNKYYLMRHAESPSNVGNYVDSSPTANEGLTEKGREQAREKAKELKNKNIDLIIYSDFLRTKETAEIVARELGVSEIVEDKRIREADAGELEGGTWQDYHDQFTSDYAQYTERPRAGGENLLDVNRRVSEFMFNLEEKYKDKNILIVSHGLPIVLLHLIESGKHTVNSKVSAIHDGLVYPAYLYGNAEVRAFDFWPFPHGANYELDLHRPYVDDVKFKCSCEGSMARVPEVVDCWVESGSMPFAQKHYPFENVEWFKSHFPSQFVAEYIAQTRTWFNYMLTMSVMLFDEIPFENVVNSGTILAENGDKMSKSLGNYPDPHHLFDKYSVDALRYYLMSSTLMKAEDLNFSERGVDEVQKKIIMRLRNVLTFYEMYGGDVKSQKSKVKSSQESKNILDTWIIARAHEFLDEVTKGYESYEVDRATRPLADMVDDLSTWYIRRSRNRFKGEDAEDAITTTKYVLGIIAKAIAPTMSFLAEDIYKRIGGEKESVHLCDWPAQNSKRKTQNSKVLEDMKKTREIVSLLLLKRAEAGIKVRQVLAEARIRNHELEGEYLELIKDEANVKRVISNKELGEEVSLDIIITPELAEEGNVRELVRFIQNLRKEAKLNPQDFVILTIETSDAGQTFVDKYKEEILKGTNANTLNFASASGVELNLGDITLKAGVV